MARNGKNDKQVKGFQTNPQEFAAKQQKRHLATKVTYKDMYEFVRPFDVAIMQLQNAVQYIVQNVPELKEKVEAEMKAQQEATAKAAEAKAQEALADEGVIAHPEAVKEVLDNVTPEDAHEQPGE